MAQPTRGGRRAPARRRPRTTSSPTQQIPAPASPLDAAIAEALARPAPEAASFAELGLPPALLTVLAADGVTHPFAIQTRVLPDSLAGRDVLGRARTGSSK